MKVFFQSSKSNLISNQSRNFAKFFSRGGGCTKNEQAFRKFQSSCEDSISQIEKLFPKSKAPFLLQMYYNCQKVSIKDKFFYDSLLQRIDELLPTITSSNDLMLLGASLNMNSDTVRDNQEFVLKFYNYAYSHRFMLKQEDRQVLSRIFSDMNLSKINKKHLDMHQELKQKDAQKLAFDLYKIQQPENLLIDFDFENRVVIMKNRKTQQMIILFGSEHHCDQSINFGKQLIDTFKPQTILVEDSPIEILKQEKFKDDSTGLIYPQINDHIYKLKGQEIETFLQTGILENHENYTYNEKQGLVYIKNRQGLPGDEPTDFPSYALHHMNKHSKDLEQAQIVFCDLSASERSTAFILGLDKDSRQHLKKELKYQILLDTTSWLADTHQIGCMSCASFLNRQKLQPYPSRPSQLLSDQQIPSFLDREKAMAHSILRQMMEEQKESNIIAFVGREHLLSVTKQIVNFLNQGDEFMKYKRPPQVIDDKALLKDDDTRLEYLKINALHSMIQDQDIGLQIEPPFIHSEEDLKFQRAQELKYLKKTILGDVFSDIEDLGIEFKKDEDFVKEKAGSPIEDDKYLKKYLDSKGGRLKCLSLSYLQGNYAYYYSQKAQFVDEEIQDLRQQGEYLENLIDYTSTEE